MLFAWPSKAVRKGQGDLTDRRENATLDFDEAAAEAQKNPIIRVIKPVGGIEALPPRPVP